MRLFNPLVMNATIYGRGQTVIPALARRQRRTNRALRDPQPDRGAWLATISPPMED